MPFFPDTVQIRRGALFLANIGVPVVFGVMHGEPQIAILGAVVGMLFGFADNDGPLSSRLRLLLLDAGIMAIGGIVGYHVRDTPLLMWPLFVLATFSVGLAAHGGREPLLLGRHGTIAFAVAATIPTFPVAQIWFMAGTVAVAAVSRSVDHWLCGPLPLQKMPVLQKPSSRGGWLRFAAALAFAATAALAVGGSLDPTHRFWIVIATIVVMQPDVGASYLRSVERVAGTFAGVVVAWAITLATRSTVVIAAAILVVAPLIPHHLASRYWLHTALIALMVLLGYDLAELNAQGATAPAAEGNALAIGGLLFERLKDILIGCAMALVGTAIAFPCEAAELANLLDDPPKDS